MSLVTESVTLYYASLVKNNFKIKFLRNQDLKIEN